ncbi:MAG: hypothetical protein HN509_06730 [Halobacteriovoraceae bacterium]|jgi:alanyl-tRNA synthetase|nr:hypothetical protein [Halobacteriovoraceae bacterium]MBT5093612.1 hypothetical protein [Halobacteriovoraceae bacterium]
MTVKKMYEMDTYLFESEAVVTALGEEEGKKFFQLDQSIFYPQGGGQPSDTGTIHFDAKEASVDFVAKDGEEIRHYFSGEPPAIGEVVELVVDQKNRLENANSHSAGHLLASIVEGSFSTMKAVKGYHFPNGSYIEFEGQLEVEKEEAIALVNQKLCQAISSKWPVEISEMGGVRQIAMGPFPSVACGGTHVANLEQIGRVVVTKVKRKKGRIRFSY